MQFTKTILTRERSTALTASVIGVVLFYALDLPLPRADAPLHRVLRNHADNLMARLPERRAIVGRVRAGRGLWVRSAREGSLELWRGVGGWIHGG